MKIAVCTGITGSQRRECLKNIENYARKLNKELMIIDAFEVLKEVSEQTIDEATVLNFPEEELHALTEKTYRKIAADLKNISAEKKADNNFAIVIITRATFRLPGRMLRMVTPALVRKLHADLYINITHNLKDLKINIEKDKLLGTEIPKGKPDERVLDSENIAKRFNNIAKELDETMKSTYDNLEKISNILG